MTFSQLRNRNHQFQNLKKSHLRRLTLKILRITDIELVRLCYNRLTMMNW